MSFHDLSVAPRRKNQTPRTSRLMVPRKSACGQHTEASGECSSCQEKNSQAQTTAVPQIVHDVLRAPGRSLDPAARACMEPHFGRDFSGVRVHTGPQAAASAQAVHAKAYAVGRDIVFGHGYYQPYTSTGRRLLAHELTHTIQQGEAADSEQMLPIDEPRSAREREAGAMEAVMHDRSAAVSSRQGVRLSRQEGDEGSTAEADGAATDATDPATTEEAPEKTADKPAEKQEEVASATCALTTYSGANFTGKTVAADIEFLDSLKTINQYAIDNDVNVHVTSSFRTSTKVKGAIVTPAEKSNHLAGHAIDMNIWYDKKTLCNSTCLGGTLPEGVKGFIKAIQDDSGLRWGGDFETPDVVHIDDGLNVNDPAEWKKRFKATQEARDNGCG